MENLDENIDTKNVSLSLIAEYGASDSDSDESEGNCNENGGNDDSESSGLSEMVLKNNIINACAHGPLSRSNVLDDVDTTRHMIIDSSESGVVEYVVAEYRDVDSDSDSSPSSESSESVDSVLDLEALSDVDEIEGSKAGKPEQPKVQGELGLEDLPPIEDLAISLPAQETTKIGTIASIVDRLVVVRAFPDTPAVDLESILFLENGSKALGKVFDVFGPVTEPHYCVRFNSPEHVKERGVQPGMDVYFAPRTQHTNYVFLSELMKLKGSDASWLNDVEPPPHHVEYSDDEEERRANRARKEERQNKQEEATGESSENPPEEFCYSGRKAEPKRTQRPSESSSRFGSGPSRGRNPFSASKRNNPPGQRFTRPWSMEARTPPPHPESFGYRGRPPFFPPPYNPATPPPFMNNSFQFGGGPRMPGPMPMMPPFRQNVPVFGAYQSQWANGPPPPPGT